MNFRPVFAAAMVCVVIVASLLAMRYPVLGSAVDYAVWRMDTDVKITSDYVVSGDARIHYSDYGKGSALVLLHGGLSSDLDWLGEIPALTQSFRLVVIDLRGHGKSTLGSTPLSYRLMAKDVVAVLDKLQIQRAHVAGWSDGGNTALLFALEYPQRINRLVAISANFNPSGLLANTNNTLANQHWHMNFGVSSWLHRWRAPDSVPWSSALESVTTLWRNYPQLTTTDLGKISAPTLVIVGTHDIIDLSHSRQMADAIPRAQLLVVPDVGHAVPRDAPGTLLLAMQHFLMEKDRVTATYNDSGCIHRSTRTAA